VHLATVDADGAFETSGVPIFSEALSTDPPGLASTGSTLVIAWSETGAIGYNLADFGGATTGGRRTFTAGGGTDSSPAAVFAGVESIIAWSGSTTPGGRDLLAARIDSTGTPTGMIVPIVTAAPPASPLRSSPGTASDRRHLDRPSRRLRRRVLHDDGAVSDHFSSPNQRA
jgi:hypothetical protein